MIYIDKAVYESIINHAREDLPNEACGYLAGTGNTVTHSFRLRNTDQSPEHFSFDPAEQFKVVKEIRNLGLEVLANYHSHPASPARPSDEDIRLAYDKSILYFIVSLQDEIPNLQAFKIDSASYKIVKLTII
jgi:proteasome lid subunit RPN8/RPN11